MKTKNAFTKSYCTLFILIAIPVTQRLVISHQTRAHPFAALGHIHHTCTP